MSEETDAIKKALTTKRKRTPIPAKNFLSSGSTTLNLACSGRISGAFYKGAIVLLVGDSDSGKTFFTMTCLAEAAVNKNFDKYRFIRDNAEGGALMDIASFFGQGVADRLEDPPRGTSEYVEDFYYNLDEMYEEGTPFIYILDSMDALESRADMKKQKEKRNAADKGNEAAGSYGTNKAKANSAGLRKAFAKLKESGSILIIITQTRDNIGPGATYNPKTRAGGRALKFYSRLEIWTSPKGEIYKTVKGKPRQLGIFCQARVKKNHVTGHKRTVTIPILHSYGFDDIGGCIDFLVEENHWKATGKDGKGKIKAPEFEMDCTRDKLIKHIEEQDLYAELKALVGQVWDEIEAACTPVRKNRYE